MKKFLKTLLIILVTVSFISCKKDKLKVSEEQIFLEADFKPSSDFLYNSGWQLTLKPNGVADIVPGGDIIYRGKYKIKGNKLIVKSEESTFEFLIVSKEELKDAKYGVVLKLKKQ